MSQSDTLAQLFEQLRSLETQLPVSALFILVDILF